MGKKKGKSGGESKSHTQGARQTERVVTAGDSSDRPSTSGASIVSEQKYVQKGKKDDSSNVGKRQPQHSEAVWGGTGDASTAQKKQDIPEFKEEASFTEQKKRKGGFKKKGKEQKTEEKVFPKEQITSQETQAESETSSPWRVQTKQRGRDQVPEQHKQPLEEQNKKFPQLQQTSRGRGLYREQSKQPAHEFGSTKGKSQFQASSDKPKDKSQHPKQPVTPGFREFAPRIVASSKSGKNIQVYANFFSLYITNPNITIYHHDVSFVPEKPKHMFRLIWNAFAAERFPNRIVVYDGCRNAYSKNALLEKLSCTGNVSVTNPETGKLLDFTVTIKEVRKINLTIFENYRQKMLSDTRKKILPESEVTVIETILKNKAANNFIEFKGVFIPKGRGRVSESLSERVELCKGYFQSVFLGYKPYVNFDIKLKPMYKNVPVITVLESFKNRKTNEINFEEVNAFLRSCKILYQIPTDPNFFQVFRVNKLVKDAYNQTFSNAEGQEISVYEYFYKEKKYKIKYPNYPLLWVGPTRKTIYIPLELCTVMPDQLYKGPLDIFETKKMVNSGTSNARVRAEKVMAAFRSVEFQKDPNLQEFGLSVSGDMEKVQARVLDPPSLKTSQKIKVIDGTWRVRDFLQPVTVNKWCILNLDKYISRETLSNLQTMIKNTGNRFKMRIGDAARTPIDGDPSFAGLRRAFSQLKDMNIVFVIIPELKGLYSKVKTICETQEGILTQCIRCKTMGQDPSKLAHTMENILLKVNAKLGGKNHSLDLESIPQCLNGYVMVVGADVTHPAPGSKGPSVAAVAVSCDPSAFQYGITTRVQIGEIIKELDKILENHLKIFYQMRRHYPDKIIFFRDGVSEGEMPQVFDTEVTAIKRACRNICDPKITFIVVTKRHHTRFYPASKVDETGKNYNVPVGTCVDTDVVHPRDLEFYLVSHSSGLGTARPTKYRLLYDDNLLTDDELERLTFYLCHLFSRCNKSVSYPSPTYNAHLAAFRARAYLEALNVRNSEELEMIQSKMKDNISTTFPMFFV